MKLNLSKALIPAAAITLQFAPVQADATDAPPELASAVVQTGFDSGPVSNSGRSGTVEVVYSTLVRVPDSSWLRLKFDAADLPGELGPDMGALIRITSTKDDAQQLLDAKGVSDWGMTSAYFNGDAVIVEVLAYPGTSPARVAVSSVTVGLPPVSMRTLCNPVDTRTPAVDKRVGRIMPSGCTAWVFDDTNHTMLTAGHCYPAPTYVVEFNVPLSSADGAAVHPAPSDQYVVEGSSIQFSQGLTGDDWCYFGCQPNSTTGLTVYQKQNAFFQTAPAGGAGPGTWCTITGYGTVMPPVAPEWNQVLKLGSGTYLGVSGTIASYRVDSSGGNSGSPVSMLSGGKAIAIHTTGSCTTTSGDNEGTALQNVKLQAALASPKGVCASGKGTAIPPLYAVGDLNNNFGTIDRARGLFGRLTAPVSGARAMTMRPQDGRMYVIDGFQRLVRLNPDTGAADAASVSIASSAPVTALAHSPGDDRFYGVCGSTGQLVVIDPVSGMASKVGAAGGNRIAAITIVPSTDSLLAIDNAGAPAAPRLVSINKATGVQSVIGSLGGGVIAWTGLAYCDDNQTLYALDGAGSRLFRVNPSSGAASLVGPTNGLWGATAGLAFRRSAVTACLGDANHDGRVDTLDLVLVLQNFGSQVVRGGGDVNADGKVDTQDLALVAAHMGCH